MFSIQKFQQFLGQLFTRQERMSLALAIGVSFVGILLAALPMPAAFHPAPAMLTVRLNAATAEELASLPGIGPVLAQRIVEDRSRHGRFVTLSDLSRVKGITAKILEKLKGSVRFD